MKNNIKLIKEYNKEKHIKTIHVHTNILKNLKYIFDPLWESSPISAPYEISTQLMDCYYCLPERPDLASLFCWQAINNSYNQYLLSSSSHKRLQDTTGITFLIEKIYANHSKYGPFLLPYYLNISEKTYHYVCSYILKGFAIEMAGYDEKFISSSYITFKKKFPQLFEIIKNSYGHKFCTIASPTRTGNKIKLNITDSLKSKKLIHSFSKKVQQLIQTGTSRIEQVIPSKSFIDITFNDKDKLTFMLFSVLYASRCNNFHGNVASRLNSINANKASFDMYTNIFLTEYMLLGIILNEQRVLSDISLNKLAANATLLL